MGGSGHETVLGRRPASFNLRRRRLIKQTLHIEELWQVFLFGVLCRYVLV